MKNNYSNLIAPAPKALNANELPKVGDVLVGTYGYEACIAVFAQVVAVTKSSVRIVMLEQNNNYTGPMEWTATPVLNTVEGNTVLKRFKTDPYGSGYVVNYNSYTRLRKWDGTALHCYNYH